MSNTKVYVIILNYNGWADTIECLESVLRSSYLNYRVVVLDNDSRDSSMERIRMWADGRLDVSVRKSSPLRRLSLPPLSKSIEYEYVHAKDSARSFLSEGPRLILVQTGENRGFAAGNNVALQRIIDIEDDAYIWLLNPDMVIEQETLTEMVRFAGGDKTGVFGCEVRDYKDTSKILFYGGGIVHPYTGTCSFVRKVDEIGVLDYISGGSLFTHLSNFAEIGLLPEEYFLYWEETDWCLQAKSKGRRFKVCAGSTCYNKGSTSVGTAYLAEYFYTLNALKFFKKHEPRYVKYILAFNSLRIFKRLIRLKCVNVRAVFDAIVSFLSTPLQPID